MSALIAIVRLTFSAGGRLAKCPRHSGSWITKLGLKSRMVEDRSIRVDLYKAPVQVSHWHPECYDLYIKRVSGGGGEG